MTELSTMTLPDLKLVGVRGKFIAKHEGGPSDDTIGQLWNELTSRIPALGLPMHWMIGVTEPTNSEIPFEMSYFAGMAVDEVPADLHGLELVELPAARYATFEHHGSMATVGDSVRTFYGELLPRSGYQVTDAPHLEVYDERFTMDDSSVFRFAAPIRYND